MEDPTAAAPQGEDHGADGGEGPGKKEPLPALQRRLLRLAADAVKPRGGCLVYATCSVLEAENEAVAGWFEDQPGHREQWEPWPFPFSTADLESAGGDHDHDDGYDEEDCGADVDDNGRRRYRAVSRHDAANRHLPPHYLATLPHLHGCDGFFIARWRRVGG